MRSIFQKVCPSCMITVPLDARECSCGYLFDHDETDPALSSEEIRLQAEELYENYLAARLEQAAHAAKTARAVYARDPADERKSARVADTMREAQAAKAALAEQSARIAELKKALPPAAKPAVPPPPVTSKKRAAPPKPVAPPPARVARKTTPSHVSVPATARPKRAAKPAVQAPARNAPVTEAAPKKSPSIPTLQTTTPPAFRQAQAARADKILRAAQHVKPAATIKKKEAPATPVMEKKIAPSVSSPTPTKAAPRLYTIEKKKDCPNCTSSVDNHAARCRCGYEFSSSEQLIPPLAMSEEERAEFAKLFNLP